MYNYIKLNYTLDNTNLSDQREILEAHRSNMSQNDILCILGQNTSISAKSGTMFWHERVDQLKSNKFEILRIKLTNNQYYIEVTK